MPSQLNSEPKDEPRLEMHKRKVIMPDGKRYIIFYSYGELTPGKSRNV